jgi:hypothetical protein
LWADTRPNITAVALLRLRPVITTEVAGTLPVGTTSRTDFTTGWSAYLNVAVLDVTPAEIAMMETGSVGADKAPGSFGAVKLSDRALFTRSRVTVRVLEPITKLMAVIPPWLKPLPVTVMLPPLLGSTAGRAETRVLGEYVTG